MRKPWKIGLGILAVLLSVAAFFWLWSVSFSDNNMHSLNYALWKLGFPTLNYRDALMDMFVDPSGDAQVLGKTKTELAARFPLKTYAEASRVERSCYEIMASKHRNVLFIRGTTSYILFTGSTATTFWNGGCDG